MARHRRLLSITPDNDSAREDLSLDHNTLHADLPAIPQSRARGSGSAADAEAASSPPPTPFTPLAPAGLFGMGVAGEGGTWLREVDASGFGYVGRFSCALCANTPPGTANSK
jgi:hypothetical protein